MIKLYLTSIITPEKTRAVAVSPSEETAQRIARYAIRDEMSTADCHPEDIIETLLNFKSPCGKWQISTDSVGLFGDSQSTS